MNRATQIPFVNVSLTAMFLGFNALSVIIFSQAVIVYCTQKCNYPPFQGSIEGRALSWIRKSGGLRHP